MGVKVPDYKHLTVEFYQSVLFGFATLIIPILILSLAVSTLLFSLRGPRLRLPGRQVLGFIFSFALVGAVAGVIAGVSMEGIVGAVLAAILGLVSSLLTYLFGQASLRHWRPVIPLAIVALMVSTLIGIVFGGSRRTQVIVQTQELELNKFTHEQVWAPAEREKRLLIIRKCFSEKNYDKAFDDCLQ